MRLTKAEEATTAWWWLCFCFLLEIYDGKRVVMADMPATTGIADIGV